MISRRFLFKSSSSSAAVAQRRCCIASSSSLHAAGPRSFATAFRATTTWSMTRTTKAGLGGLVLLLAASDPVVSAYEESSSFGGTGGGLSDDNSSYWMASWLAGREAASNDGASPRTTDDADGESRGRGEGRGSIDGPAPPPTYSKVVVVGGGMAGLHTALALAERTFDPSTQTARPPPSEGSWRRVLLWPFQRTGSPMTNNDDAKIIILEASQIGRGASGRSMGWVGHGYQVPHENILANAVDAPIVNTYSIPALLRSFQSVLYNAGVAEMPPPERYTISIAEKLHALSIEAMDRVRDIVIKYDIDCDWTEGGAVHGLLHDDKRQVDKEKEGMLTASQVNQIMGRNNDANSNNNDNDNDRLLYKSGEFDMTCGAVNPLRLTLGLADAVDKWGVQIYEQTKVIKLQRRSGSEDDTKGKYSIITNGGHIIHCDHVVLCTGAGTMSADISRRLSYSFLPFYTWMTATEPLHEECPIKDTSLVNVVGSKFDKQRHVRRRGEDKDRPAPPTYGDDHVILNYWRTNDYSAGTNDNSEGRILFGSLWDTYPFPQWLASWRLRSAMSEIYPKFANVHFDYIWGGKLAMAINPMPLIGRDIDFDDAANTQNGTIACDGGSKLTEGGVWYATAFAGHGIIPTAVAGSLIANAILGISDHQEWKLFHTHFPPSTWNGYPFSRLGAGAVLSLYNTFDWLAKRGVPVPPLPDLW